MLNPIHIFSRGSLPRATRLQTAPPVSQMAPPQTSVRLYTNKKDEFLKDADQTLREIKSNVKPGIDFKSAIPKESSEYIEHYREFYGEVAGPGKSAVSPYHADFYKKPEADRKIYTNYHNNIKEFYLKFLSKTEIDDITPGLARINAIMDAKNAKPGEPVRVCITGAAGAIGYALAFRIAGGGLFGASTPVILHLLELPNALNALKGVEMELLDCAFPTLKGIVTTDNAEKAFDGIDYALLVGAQPRIAGMERGDLLLKNAEIFAIQGKALNVAAKGPDTRVVVVGNPANTNALIAAHHAKSIPKSNFIAMTRLDHNRAVAKVAEKAKVPLSSISRVIIWGNHSATQYPDLSHALIDEKLALDVIKDDAWVKNTFIPGVQQRGAEIIKTRGASSAASAASSALDTVFDWHFGTCSEWMSAAVHSKGEYGVTSGLFYSYPVIFNDSKNWDTVKDLPLDEFSAQKMELTHKELLSERDGVAKFLA